MNPNPDIERQKPSGTAASEKSTPPWAQNRFEGIKTAATLVALVAGIILFGWFIVTKAFQTSDVGFVNKVLSEAVSPDGKWRAVQFVHGGAPTTFTAIGIQDRKLAVDPTKQFNYVLAIEWRQDFKLKWEDARHLTITIPKEAAGCKVMAQKDKYEDVEVKYNKE